MTSPLTGDRIIDIGPPEWCWSHLSDADEGLLSYQTSRGPITLAVLYTIADQQITIPVAPFNDTAWLATGRDATLEVTGHGDDGLRWVVRATGPVKRTESMSPTRQEISRLSHPANGPNWRATASSDQLVLPSARVRGFYETSLQPSVLPGIRGRS
jgi:hypothetical protein